MSCSNCDHPKVVARGLCAGCYSRLRRRGTLARKNVVNRGECTEPGCDRKAFSKNLCGLHYQRAQHPLNSTWRSIRSRCAGQYPEHWSRFDTFLSDVGERPTPLHQLRRPDPEKAWGAGNFVWREPIGVGYTENAKQYAWRWHLRKKYDLSLEELEAMKVAQGGLCATCPTPLDSIDPATGKAIKICVDHDHLTNAVRGILCDYCNKALGGMKDDPVRLTSAIIYLAKHAGKRSILETAIRQMQGALKAIRFADEV